MHLRYLHISDLHLTGQPKERDGWAVEQFNQDLVTRSMLDAIEELVRQDGQALDLIFITGDLAKRGKPEEYQVAQVLCQQLLKVTGVPAGRLFIVPGNHDVDRGKVEERHIRRLYHFEQEDQITEVLGDPDMFPVLMRKFAAFNDFAGRVLGHRLYTEREYFFAETVSIPKNGETVPVNVVGLNSALFAGYDGDDAQKLAFGLPQVEAALRQLDDKAWLTVALFHHPFPCFHPADKVCRNRLMQKADLLLTGHLHEPDNMFVRGAAGQAVLIGAGASFEKRESENSFNIVQIDLDSGAGEVQFYKYLPNFHRWKENTEANPDYERGVFPFVIEGIKRQAPPARRSGAEPTSGIGPPAAPPYIPPPPPDPDVLPEPCRLPPGSRITFHRNALFTDREGALKTLARALLYDKIPSALVTQAIEGMGGVGKTELAIEFVHRYGSFFYGVHWLNAARPEAIDTEVAACGAVMGLPNWPSQQPDQIARTLAEWQRDGPRIVVLDNLEDVAVAREWLDRLSGAPLRLLITARRPDWPPDLGLAQLSLGVFVPQDSRAFLRRYVLEKQATDADLDKLAERLGHLPLALELAGRYLYGHPHFSVSKYLEKLKNVWNHPSMAGWREDLGCHTLHDLNLAATFAVSWKGVTDKHACRLFLLAGFCASDQPIPYKLLKKASGLDYEACDSALAILIGRGLLERKDNSNDLIIHCLLAEYACSIPSQERTSLLPSLACALDDLAHKAIETGLPANFSLLRSHVEKVAIAAENAGLKEAMSLWDSLGSHLKAIADYEDARKACEHALALAKQFYGPDGHQVAARFSNLGEVLRDLGSLVGALDCFERALAIDRSVFDPNHPTIADHLHNKGCMLKDMGKLQEAREAFEQAVDCSQRALDADETLDPKRSNRARYLHSLGWALKDLGDLTGAQDCFNRSLEIDEVAFGSDDPGIVHDLSSLGWVLKDLGDGTGARAAFKRALRIDENAFGPNHPNVVRDLRGLGWLHRDWDDRKNEHEVFARVLAICQAVYGEKNAHVATACNDLGTALLDLGDLAGAQASFEQALGIDEAVFDSTHPSVARDLKNLANALTGQGDLEGALNRIKRALAIDERHFGPKHPNVATHIRNVGWILKDRGDLNGARFCFSRALEIDEACFGLEHPEIVFSVNSLGWTFKDRGDFGTAANCFRRALETDKEAFGPRHHRVACDLRNMGWVFKDQSNLEEAGEYFCQALEINSRTFGPDHPNVACDIRNVGWLLKDRGKNDLAGAWLCFLRALEIDEAFFGPDCPEIIPDISGLGHVLRDRGDLAGAKTAFERAQRILESPAAGPPAH